MDYITKFFEDFSANFDSFCDKYFVKLLICVGVILVFLALKFILTAAARRIIKKSSDKKSGSAERIDYIYGIILPPVRILTVTAALAVCFLILKLDGKAYTIGLDAITSLLLFAVFRGMYGFCDYIKYLVLRGYEKKGRSPTRLPPII